MMRKILFFVPVAVLALTAFTGDVSAQTATVTYKVDAINEMSVAGDPATLSITKASELSGVSATTDWSATTNQTGMSISGSIGGATNAMPAGVTLTVQLAGIGTTKSATDLSDGSSKLLVDGITKTQATGIATYTLSASPSADPMTASATKTVTYTVTAGT